MNGKASAEEEKRGMRIALRKICDAALSRSDGLFFCVSWHTGYCSFSSKEKEFFVVVIGYRKEYAVNINANLERVILTQIGGKG